VLGGWGMGPGQTGGGVGAGAVLSQGVCDDDEGDGVWLFPGGRGKPIAQARPPHLQITRKVSTPLLCRAILYTHLVVRGF
jgi:hypothetical protein